MADVIGFMQSTAGRLLRLALGVVLIAVGIFVIHGVAGIVVALIGLVPLAAGLAGVCFLAPLFGYTLKGERRLHAR
jgi:hypothetical protein